MKTILVDAFNTFVIKDHGIDQDMYKLLETFPNKKIILTNANDEELVKFGLVDLPYEIFSLKHEPNKTDPKYYETMLERLGLKKDDVIYFEHNQAAVESAMSVGINTYHFDHMKRDLVKLESFLRTF